MKQFDNNVYICQQERTQELNDRIMDRNQPSIKMNTVYDPRPAETRRVIFPGIDTRHKSSIPIQDSGYYSQKQVFNPGSKAPYSGFAHAVDAESSLKNIFMANQKYCVQSQYVPSTVSDLYNMDRYKQTEKQSHPLLFKRESVNQPTPNTFETGREMFNNHTRQQLKDVGMSTLTNKCYYD